VSFRLVAGNLVGLQINSCLFEDYLADESCHDCLMQFFCRISFLLECLLADAERECLVPVYVSPAF